jgi:glycosyltransferase involved in cell wall biosynthesis
MTNVAIDCRLLGREFSGIAKFLVMMIKGLQEISALPFDIRLLVSEGQSETALLKSLLGDLRFPALTVRTKPFTIKDQFLLPDVLKNNKIGIFYTPYFGIPLVCDAKTISTFHDLIPVMHPEYVAGTAKGRYNRLFRFVNALAVRRSHHIVVVSETTRNDFFLHYGIHLDSKVSVVYEGVEKLPGAVFPVSRDVRVFSEKKPYLLYVGRQDPYKNIPGLLAAFQRLRDKIYGVNLVIAGKKDPRFFPQLRLQTQQLKISNAVCFTDRVNETELDVLYSGAAALVNPSFYEGFGLTPLEGFLRGCPAAVSKIPVNEEILDVAALYFDPRDPSDMEGKLAVLLREESTRRDVAEKGKERVKVFSCRKAAEHLVEVFIKIQN